MKTRSLIAILAVLALAGGFAVHATREASQTRAAIDTLTTQRSGLQATTANLEQRLRKADAALAQPEQNAELPSGDVGFSPGTAGGAAAGSDIGANAVTPSGRRTAATIIASDPKRMTEYLQNYRASLDLYYGNRFKALGLSAEQVEQIKDFWVSWRQQRMDIDAAVALQGLDPDSAVGRKLKTESWKTWETKERELLGERWNAYREYAQAEPVRFFAQELAGTAVYSGLPVTCAQVERTTQILAANSQRYSSGYVNRNTVNWPAARVQLQEVLSPPQIEILGAIVDRFRLSTKQDSLTSRLTAEFKAKQGAVKGASGR
jgi:hypothetical protein